MKKTAFAGLTELDVSESILEDNGAFTGRDRETIDRFLQIGAKTHRHDGSAGLSNPTAAPSAAVIGSAGTIAADLSLSVGYTAQDDQRGETLLSPVATASTPGPLVEPQHSPSAEVKYDSGELTQDNYYYGITYVDASGGETPLGPVCLVTRQPGYEHARVALTSLDSGMAAAGAYGWRLYRQRSGGSFVFLASGTGSSYTDDGTVSPVCDSFPPNDNFNSTNSINTLVISLPAASKLPVGTEFINVYVSQSGAFSGQCFLEQYPVASAGRSFVFRALELADDDPPDVNTSVGAAAKIDPDTELEDWHWKRPVTGSGALPSGEHGDVRLATDTGNLYAVLGGSATAPGDWRRVASGGGAAGPGSIAASGTGGKVAEVEELIFVGSGGANVAVTSPSLHQAKIVVTAPSAAQGPKGDTGATGSAGATGATGASGATGPPGLPTVRVAGNPGASTGTKSISPTEMTGTSLGKIGSEGALDGVALAVGDLFFNFSGTTRDGVWEVTNLGSSETRWVAKRPSGLDTSATVQRSMFTVKEGSTYGHKTFMCDSTGITLGTTELVFRQVANRDYGLVSALPTTPTPIKGDRCEFIADNTNGIIWHLIYDGEGEFPWKKIGGPPLRNAPGSPATASTVFQSVGAPSIAAPLAGEYDQFMEADVSNGVAELNVVRIGTFIGGVEGGSIALALAASFVAPMSWRNRVTAAKGAAIQVRFKSESAKSATFFGISTEIDPVRVG